MLGKHSTTLLQAALDISVYKSYWGLGSVEEVAVFVKRQHKGFSVVMKVFCIFLGINQGPCTSSTT